MADAHPAPEEHVDARFLAGFEQRRCAVDLDGLAADTERHGAAGGITGVEGEREPLDVQVVARSCFS